MDSIIQKALEQFSERVAKVSISSLAEAFTECLGNLVDASSKGDADKIAGCIAAIVIYFRYWFPPWGIQVGVEPTLSKLTAYNADLSACLRKLIVCAKEQNSVEVADCINTIGQHYETVRKQNP